MKLKSNLSLKGSIISLVAILAISGTTTSATFAQERSIYRNNSLQGRHDDRNMRQEFRATLGAYIESDINMEEAVRYEFGPDFRLAEWNDIKQIRDIDRWIVSTKLIPGRKYFVQRNGRFIQSGNRVYFFLFSPNGRVPSGFLVHDMFAGKFFLGSWYGDYCHILASKGESYRDDMRRDDPPRGDNGSEGRGENDRNRPGEWGGIRVTMDRYSDRVDLNEQISQTQSQKGSVEDFLAAFEKLPETLTAFSLDAFNALTDYLTVNSEGDISVTFRNGQTIKA